MTHATTTYDNALVWLFAQTRANAPRNPERARALLRDLGLRPPKNAVHVVGTNGKGTVANLIARGLSLSGRRTGLFISPHVEEFRERVSVDGERIGEEEVLGFVQKAQRLEKPYAFFELCFALASAHFWQKDVEMSVIEAGVGARNDATIILEEVRAVVITNVSLDHQDTLGSTLTDIARDKAEAVRPGVPTFTAAKGEALEIIKKVADERRSPLHVPSGADSLLAKSQEVDQPAYRLENLRLASAVLRDLGVAESQLVNVLQTPALPGRREVFKLRDKTVILDGGHNPAAAEALLTSLIRPFVLVFGALAKKQGGATLAVLEPRARATVLTQAAGQLDPSLLNTERHYVPDPVEAVTRALELCPAGTDVLVTGSLYLAGQLRPYLSAQVSG